VAKEEREVKQLERMLEGGPIFIALLAKLTFKINRNDKLKTKFLNFQKKNVSVGIFIFLLFKLALYPPSSGNH